MLDFILIAGGFVGLIYGGNLLVQGAVAIAQRLNISPMIIGLTLVGFGTSMPELVTSVQAAFIGSPGIAIGNVIGSNIANILLILGTAAVLQPMLINPSALRRDGSVLVAVSLLCLAMLLYGTINRPFALVLLIALAAYIVAAIMSEKRKPTPAVEFYEAQVSAPVPSRGSSLRDAITLLAGFALTIVSARFLVMGAVSLAQSFNVSDAVIGLTVVAVGTSLPELITSIVAARKGESDVAIGNVIGSNIFNILGILGVTALLKPIAVPPQFIALDIWVMLTATALLLFFARTGWRIGRGEAAIMLLGYIGYTSYLIAAI